MGGYIANFTVYTMAMLGLIFFAVFVYKKFMDGTMQSNNSKFLSLEESMSLSPRKTLHIVRAGKEKFLIASDIDRTTLISKLGTETKVNCAQNSIDNFNEIISKQHSLAAYNEISNKQQENDIEVAKSKNPTSPKTVHLEPIKVRNTKTKMDNRLPDNVQNINNRRTVNIDVQTNVDHGFSTMKEMAKKINEL